LSGILVGLSAAPFVRQAAQENAEKKRSREAM